MACKRLVLILSLCLLTACDTTWNNPYPNQGTVSNTVYTAFTQRPKHLDPAISYDSNSGQFMAQTYEPVIEYSYLMRPYKLEPLTATKMPTQTYDPVTNITTYKISIQKDIKYQPHPAFAKDANGNFVYHNLSKKRAQKFRAIADFRQTGTRTLTAHDYANQIKRLSDPTLNSPIFGFLSPYIVGLAQLRTQLIKAYAKSGTELCLDLRSYDLEGVRVIDDWNYEIKIHGKYDQFIYWLQMLFFSPVPWEAAKFYCQAGFEDHNINLDNYPIGTGPFYMIENNPERRMVMLRNPNYRQVFYPKTGMPADKGAGLLKYAGQQIPFIDKIVLSLERESIPYWDKFLQGYYDRSGISSNNFNSALSQATGDVRLNEQLTNKGIYLTIADTLTISGWGFNMIDDTVGGYAERAKNLRKAISLAFDMQEFITIFLNGRAVQASGPIPPGILGYEAYKKTNVDQDLHRAKQLMALAGYPNGIDSQTGKPLQIYYDAVGTGDPNQRSVFGWVTKQFNKLGIDLIVRVSDYNRFLDKMRNGSAQFFVVGWSMDYPDPENVLFLFYGANSVIKYSGENISNYNNADFDALFSQFKAMGASPARLPLIHSMLDILKDDAPWIWGFFAQDYILANPWYAPTKPNAIALNTLKYVKVDPGLRASLRKAWNQPIIWPIFVTLLITVIILLPACIGYWQSTRAKARRID